METKMVGKTLPIINGLQKMALYETKSRIYLIASNNLQSKFRVLKIDRLEPQELIITDDMIEYSQRQIKDLLTMINEGNRSQSGQRLASGLARTVSAFGIVGFVRFLEGYYLVLVTKRRKVAVIGHHSIYKVEDTTMIYIPHESVRKSRDDELKYQKLFQNIDLSSNFYFSYSYDLTHSLQYNITPPKDLPRCTVDTSSQDDIVFGIQNIPCDKFVWNSYLLKPAKSLVHPAWILPLIHGFISQSNICVYGHSMFLTLIARRSCRYAGTRFLKRGANFEGDVANEVETEQIVHDAHIASLSHGRFTAFVQTRGSIPSHWSQDVSKMVPKPPISFDVMDPYAETAGKHFNQLLRRFGSPIVVLNLVKRRERKAHESILNTEYSRLINQLNITLPPQFRIQHVAVDMARINKQKDENVMSRLSQIAYSVVKKTGIFQSHPPYYSHTLNPDLQYRRLEKSAVQGNKGGSDLQQSGRKQTGIVRVNCVDCLDRTNTAQFSLGKCALAFQLYILGVLDRPALEFDSDTVRMLEEMYEDHGDTLALQYGGSNLVHRIKTYRRTAPWTSQGNDIMQTLSRYYSNTFSDTEKQNAMNLFLGVYIPRESSMPLWELTSDYLLHHTRARGVWPCHRPSTSQWWDADVMGVLPYAVDETDKEVAMIEPLTSTDPRVDLYLDYHRPSEFSVLNELFTYTMSHSVRDYMPHFTTDDSPFSVRRRPGRRQEELSKGTSVGGGAKNLALIGDASNPVNSARRHSCSSTESEGSEADQLLIDEGSEGEISEAPSITPSFSFVSLFPPMKETYGDNLHNPKRIDYQQYQRYIQIDQSTKSPSVTDSLMTPAATLVLIQRSSFSCDSTEETHPPNVPRKSRHLYHNYVKVATCGPQAPTNMDLLMYQKYATSV